LEEETRSAKQLTMAEETHSPLKEVSITETLLGVPPSSYTNLQSNHNHIIKDTAAEELHSITTQLRRIGSKTELSNTSLLQQELEIDVPIFLSIPDFSLDKQSNDARAQINDHRSNQIHHESNTSSFLFLFLHVWKLRTTNFVTRKKRIETSRPCFATSSTDVLHNSHRAHRAHRAQPPDNTQCTKSLRSKAIHNHSTIHDAV
jgi:hypothetical protein